MNWKNCFKRRRIEATPAWMKIAISQQGVKETPGPEDNPTIKGYRKPSGNQDDGDETPWCADFVGWCLEQVGIAGTKKQNARSYLEWGEKITTPRLGCIAILWRESKDSWKGHVAFYAGESQQHVVLLGGNQNNAVGLESYPHDRVLEYRWPKGQP